MIINLKNEVDRAVVSPIQLCVSERLPLWIDAPCELTCTYHLKKGDKGLYLIDVRLEGELLARCLRCFESVTCAYAHVNCLAVCRNDAEAERLMSRFDCVVSVMGELDLIELVTDELHLYPPTQVHASDHCQLQITG